MFFPGLKIVQFLNMHGLVAVLIAAALTIAIYGAIAAIIGFVFATCYKKIYGASFAETTGKKFNFLAVGKSVLSISTADTVVNIPYAIIILIEMYSPLITDSQSVKIYVTITTIGFTTVSAIRHLKVTHTDLSIFTESAYTVFSAIFFYLVLFLTFLVTLKFGGSERPGLDSHRWDSVLMFIIPSSGGLLLAILYTRISVSCERRRCGRRL